MKLRSKLAAMAIAALACGGQASAATVVVNVYDFDFSIGSPDQEPIDPVINVGDIIQWVWLNGEHTTTAAAGQTEFWESPLTDEVGFTFSHTFTHTGVFNYYCVMHGFETFDGQVGGMSGTITVIPSPAVAPLLALGALLPRRRRR